MVSKRNRFADGKAPDTGVTMSVKCGFGRKIRFSEKMKFM